MMKKDKLLEALNIASRVTPAKPILPILGSALMTCFGGKLVVNATNLELTVEVETEGDGEFRLAVPSKKLNEIVSNLTDEDVYLSQDGETLKIKCGKYRGQIKGLNPEDFPIRDFGTDMRYVNVVEFREQTQSVTYASSTDELRPISGVLLEAEGSKLRMVSTDGFRLALAEESYDTDFPKTTVLVPNSGLREVYKILNTVKADKVGLSIGESVTLYIEGTSKVRVDILPLSGNFPTYERIIPESCAMEVVVHRNSIINACKQVNVISKESNGFAKMKFGNGITISSYNDGVGNTDVGVDAEVKDELEVGVNINYLMDALNSINTAEAVFELGTSTTPIAIKNTSDKNQLHIIMPMRIQ